MIKHLARTLSAAIMAMIVTASAAWCEVNLNVSIGLPLPTIVIAEPPEFILPSSLGFYVAVGTPYDLYQVDNVYFLFRDNRWFKSPYYNGPWREVRHKKLPKVLRRHNYERIRYYRDEEYRHYRHDRHKYRGRYFRPERIDRRDDNDGGRRHENRHDDDRRHERSYDRDEHRGGNGRDEQKDWNPWKQNRDR
jgi:hypothetical protein